MKSIKFAKLLVLGLVLNLAAIGCHHKRPEGVTHIPGPEGITGPEVNPSNGIPFDATSLNPTNSGGIPIDDDKIYDAYTRHPEVFKLDTVHFAFDSSVVKEEEKSKVGDVAEHLKSDPTAAVEIEGHCDERGTEEYNRSLGERRALALREALIGDGIAATKVVTISYGKDKPENPGHDEAAWKENRRGVFILLTPPSKVQ